MAVIIIKGGNPNVAIAKDTKTFAQMGFTSDNISIVFEVGDTLKSWKPGRTINAITGITAGNGYYIIPKIDIDVSQYFGTTDGGNEWLALEW